MELEKRVEEDLITKEVQPRVALKRLKKAKKQKKNNKKTGMTKVAKKSKKKTAISVPSHLEEQTLSEKVGLISLNENQAKKLSTKRRRFQSKIRPQILPDLEIPPGFKGYGQFPALNLRLIEVKGKKEELGLNTAMAIEV